MKRPQRWMVLGICLGSWAVASALDSTAAFHTALQPGAPTQQSLESYRQHLRQLQTILAKCSAARTAPNCDPKLVGPDDLVETSAGSRQVQYAWLRYTMSSAVLSSLTGKNAGHAEASGKLQAAVERLRMDSSLPDEPRHGDTAQARRTLASILAKSEFNHVRQPSLWEHWRDIFLRWLDERLRRLLSAGGGSDWPTRIAFAACILSVCGGLVGWFARQVKRQGLLLPSLERSPAAPSANDWEKWLSDAKRSAALGLWREAVHGAYWAAISRLESRGLWPADRTRTPREYLSLLTPEDSKRTDLAALTRAFESIWYGNKRAAERDFQDACALLEKLVAR
jgi:hypothetical protein